MNINSDKIDKKENIFSKLCSFFTRNWLCFISLFVIIYCSDDSLFFSTNSNKTIKLVGYFLLLILGICLLVYMLKKKIKFKATSIMVGVYLLIAVFLTCLVNLDFAGEKFFKYFIQIACILLCILLINIFSIKQICKNFVAIILLISSFSTIVFGSYYIFLKFVKINVLNWLPTFSNYIGNHYYFGFFSHFMKSDISGWLYLRNLGIFREPGVFAVYLLLALAILWFMDKNICRRIIGSIIILLTMITTQSTTGYFGLICFYIVIMFFDVKNKLLNNIKYAIPFVFIITFLIMYLCKFDFVKYTPVLGKMLNLNSGSRSSRFYMPLINLELFFKSPIVGLGWTQSEIQHNHLATLIQYSDHSDANTIFSVFGTNGLLLGVPFISSLFIISKLWNNEKKTFFGLIFLFLLVTFATEKFTVSWIFYILIFIAFDSSEKVLVCSNYLFKKQRFKEAINYEG